MKVWNPKGYIFIISAVLIHGYDCARILGIFEVYGKSHFQMSEALLKALAARGHEVVVMSHFPQKTPVPNYTDVDVSGSVPRVMDNVTIEMVELLNDVRGIPFFWKLYRENCRKALSHPRARSLLQSTQSFDLVVTEIFASECTVGFAHRFDAPLISIDTSVGFPWTHKRIGNPDHPAYMANYFLPYTSKMTFWQRVKNTVFTVILNSGNYFLNSLPTSAVMKDIFGDDTPSLEELCRNTSLILVNSHFSITDPRPTVPNYIEVGGLHITTPKDLPQDIKKFMDESKHGVIYFSLGSLLQVQTLPPEKLSALMSAFAALPERVIMKYTGSDLPAKPDNVMTGKWLPQQAILWHPKIKLFISHGGQMSIQEAVYAGVPVIGIPLFADQALNIMRLVDKQTAVKVSYEELTRDTFLKAIRAVTDDKRYSKNARRLSALYRDRPMSPMDTAVYWVEYVIRHRGAPHLRSLAADMPLHQYLLLDVIAVLLLVLVGTVCIAYCAFKVTLGLSLDVKAVGLLHKLKLQ